MSCQLLKEPEGLFHVNNDSAVGKFLSCPSAIVPPTPALLLLLYKTRPGHFPLLIPPLISHSPLLTNTTTHFPEQLVSQKLDRLKDLDAVAPHVTRWLSDALLETHESRELKARIGQLLGTFFYTGSLEYLNSWNGLKSRCRSIGLDMGKAMLDYHVNENLGDILGKTVPTTTKPPLVQLCHAFPQATDTISQPEAQSIYAHTERMVAMGLAERLQNTCREICNPSGILNPATVKSHSRMIRRIGRHDLDTCPSLNLDVLRNTVIFETPYELLACLHHLQNQKEFGGATFITNQFAHDNAMAARQFYFRAITMSWKFQPGITYGELGVDANKLWERYKNYAYVPGYGHQDPRESWQTWRSHIAAAKEHLESRHLGTRQVECIVETQFTLRPFFEGRKKTRTLYRVYQADTLDLLYREFVVPHAEENMSYVQLQDAHLAKVQACLADPYYDVNAGSNSALFHAAFSGYERAVGVLLAVPGIEINRARSSDGATPLYMAVDQGHYPVVKMLVSKQGIDVNRAQGDVGFPPLYAAADKGQDRIVECLLSHPNIDVNKARTDLDITPLLIAASLGHERTVRLLLAHDNIDINRCKRDDGTTPLHWARVNGYTRIVQMLVAKGATKNRCLSSRV
jgi:hypothetical protein